MPNTPIYSTLFSCLHDEPTPVGQLGRGAHYSILRCVEWLNVDRAPLAKPEVHDFAVIWDEDHDDRVMVCIERLYMAGLLSPVQFIGERKGCLTLILAARYFWKKTDSYVADVKAIVSNLEFDSWSVDFGSFDRSLGSPQNVIVEGFINDRDERVITYLRNIDNLWSLGTRPYVHNQPNRLNMPPPMPRGFLQPAG